MLAAASRIASIYPRFGLRDYLCCQRQWYCKGDKHRFKPLLRTAKRLSHKMVEQSTIRTIVLGVVVIAALHTLVASFSTTSSLTDSSKKDEGDEEQTERLKPWRERWDTKRIGFHINEVSPWLVKYVDKILPATKSENDSNTRVFVPLCGKTIDMAYLTEHFSHVVGVEGIRQALMEFVQEHPDLKISLKTTMSKGMGTYEKFSGPKVSLLKGDYFELDETVTGGKFDAVIDRGSMVAIEPSLRKDYVNIIGKLLVPGGKILLVTLERQGSDMEAVAAGPPYSISEQQVRDLYHNGLGWVESITLLESKDRLVDSPEERSRYQGLDHLIEHIFLIQAKSF